MHSHEDCMQLALEQAYVAEKLGEIPVGAVVLLDGKVVGTGYNQTISESDPTAHAEVVAIRAAAKLLGNYRLDKCTLYVTLEPCTMCMGAIFHSRIAKVYFGAFDPKTGACGSVLNLPSDHRINHHCQVVGGVSQTQCGLQLSGYFERLRASKSLTRVPLREDALRLPHGALSSYMGGVKSQPVDDLKAANGLRIQIWQNPASTSNPKNLVLCLHGATSWSYIYRAVLTADIPARTMVLALDFPGHGGSDKTKKGGEFEVANQLSIVNDLLVRFTASTIHLLGQDTGCELAVRLAAGNPGRISGMTLFNPVCMDSKPSLNRGAAIRSRQQFIAALQDQCERNMADIDALSAPYPDAGHLMGMLRQLTMATTDIDASVATISTDCTNHSVVHVSHVFFAEYLQFQSKFGLTFKLEEHSDSCVFLGLKRPTLLNDVLRQICNNG